MKIAVITGASSGMGGEFVKQVVKKNQSHRFGIEKSKKILQFMNYRSSFRYWQ